ncbi:MAG: cob(I)yrinic acid a,c-diamide adenosyltransferase [Emergencia sp.]|nr:cob(I)yrinic acid a,c-diamide adenosyltransferase [Emergencia sp.]
MTKIYTKTGDDGRTGLYGGSRIKKSSNRVNAYGAVDEANALIGLAAVHIGSEELQEGLRMCQRHLFVIGAELASDSRGRRMLKESISEKDTIQLERLIDVFSEKLQPERTFQIPGKTVKSAYLHVARTAVRKAERLIVGVKEEALVSEEVLRYMNRLSDFLFILTRAVDELDVFCKA